MPRKRKPETLDFLGFTHICGQEQQRRDAIVTPDRGQATAIETSSTEPEGRAQGFSSARWELCGGQSDPQPLRVVSAATQQCHCFGRQAGTGRGSCTTLLYAVLVEQSLAP